MPMTFSSRSRTACWSEAARRHRGFTARTWPRSAQSGQPNACLSLNTPAPDVAKVDPDLVARDDQGKPYTVRYEAVNAMLLNEFLKEHRKVEEQGAIIAKQQKQIEALTAGLQKVSAQIELSKFATGRIRLGGPAPQMVLNSQ